ncbi:MAG: C39 family peptidase [Anaerolineae bacterium]|nr:C39 family peptidase [Anaerolineae bacterium]
MNLKRFFLLAIPGGLVLLVAASLLVPSIRERITYRLDEWSIRLQYALKPPEKQVFLPQTTPDANAQAALTPTPTAEPSATPTHPPELPTPTPTLTATPLPPQASVNGVPYVDQKGLWNYCAPANLTMALKFWGWTGERTDVGQWVKPFEKDKNVMPYELADYVTSQTNLGVVYRSGGSLELLKRFISAGFPVLIEKGAYLHDLTGKISWMGHYAVVDGYDDATGLFNTQDSYLEPNLKVEYSALEHNWRAFNFVYLIIYPREREAEVLALLGDSADEVKALQGAAQLASEEIFASEGVDLFFAWYNRGTSLVGLQDFAGAAAAYDEAFKVYAALPEKDRPWRMVWYQTGPYFAYYYAGRYTDVINLATQTLDAASEPYLEESYYWRGLARIAVGDQPGAVEDLRKSLEYHPQFAPSLAALTDLGVSP